MTGSSGPRRNKLYYQHTQSLFVLCQVLGWVVTLQKSELDPQLVFDFVGYQYDFEKCLVKPTPERWEVPNTKKKSVSSTKLYSEAVHVPKRPPHWHRRTGPLRLSTYETHSVAPKSKVACARASRKNKLMPVPKSIHKLLMTSGRECLGRPDTISTTTRSAKIYQCIKHRLGCSLRRLHNQGSVVYSGE